MCYNIKYKGGVIMYSAYSEAPKKASIKYKIFAQKTGDIGIRVPKKAENEDSNK